MKLFDLDERIKRATIPIVDWTLSRLCLMNERRYWWLLLVPRRPDVSELLHLTEVDSIQLMKEIRAASAMLLELPGTEKINVAMLGNQVRQLHIHVLARQLDDAAWPQTVWDKGPSEPMNDEALVERKTIIDATIVRLGLQSLRHLD